MWQIRAREANYPIPLTTAIAFPGWANNIGYVLYTLPTALGPVLASQSKSHSSRNGVMTGPLRSTRQRCTGSSSSLTADEPCPANSVPVAVLFRPAEAVRQSVWLVATRAHLCQRGVARSTNPRPSTQQVHTWCCSTVFRGFPRGRPARWRRGTASRQTGHPSTTHKLQPCV